MLLWGVGACKKTESTLTDHVLEGSVEAANDPKATRKLFDDAAACGDKYNCPALDELIRRTKDPRDTTILGTAFDIMCDPNVRSFDRLGDAAWHVAQAWATGRVQRNAFDDASKKVFLAGVMRMLKGDSPTFITPAISLLAGQSGYNLPGAEQILKDQALNPKRIEALDLVAQLLRPFQKDLSLVKLWLQSKDAWTMLAGTAVLEWVDHSLIKQVEDELPFLLTVAKRPDLPVDVARALVRHVRSHEDNDFLPVLQVLSRNPDKQVQADAAEAIAYVKQTEADRAAQ